MSESKIKPLSPGLTALIAAGEVVERPASVVKELVENALDAGAQAISVDVREGGLAHLRVSDDGSGMSRTDTPLAVKAFTTSKISKPDDLGHIRTYGFRGEALNSIAAVAHLEILTRTQAELEGTHLRSTPALNLESSPDLSVSPAASPVGTRVTISRLFEATPARRKFLKSPYRELELIQRVIERYALTDPKVAFRLLADDRSRLTLPPGSMLERIGALFGREVADAMLKVEWQAMDLRIWGYISHPEMARSRRDRQFFIVNGRPIRSGLLAVMLERPYAGRLPPGRHPLAVIHITVAPSFVDVNVHPQKAEVRFSRERSIYSALSQAIGEVLSEFPRLFEETGADFPWPFAGLPEMPPGEASLLRDQPSLYQVESLRPLAQIHHTYILAQAADSVLIIDQHAAHEQILYERCSSQTEMATVGPLQIQLTSPEATLLTNHLSLFTELGFDLEPYGGQTFILRGLPADLQAHLTNQVTHTTQPLEATLLSTLLNELTDHKTLDQEAQRDKLAQKAACVCAIKAGDILSEAGMRQLLTDLVETWSPVACPHGRPIFVNLSLHEIEQRFGRR